MGIRQDKPASVYSDCVGIHRRADLFRRGLLLKRLFTALGVLVILAGIGTILLFSLPAYERSLETESWPTVTGTIVESRLERSSGPGSNRTSTSDKTEWDAVIRYSYDANGVTMKGDRINWIQIRSTQSARKLVRKYKVGTEVMVSYDPESPGDAVLEPGASLVGAFFVPAIMFFLGSLFIVLELLSARKARRLGT